MPIPDNQVVINKEEAAEILAKKENGAYIYGKSQMDSSLGTEGILSYKDTLGNIKHVDVKRVSDGLVIEYQNEVTQEKEYKELNEFIKSNNLTQYVNPEILATPKEAPPQQQDSNPTPPKKAAPPDYPHIDRQINPLFKGINKSDDEVSKKIIEAVEAGKTLMKHLLQELEQINKQGPDMKATHKELSTQYKQVVACLGSLSEAAKDSTPRNVNDVTKQLSKTEKAFANASDEKKSLFKKFCKCACSACVVLLAVGFTLATAGLGALAGGAIYRAAAGENQKTAEKEINKPDSSPNDSINIASKFITETTDAIKQLRTKTDPAATQQQAQTTDVHQDRGYGPVSPGRR